MISIQKYLQPELWIQCLIVEIFTKQPYREQQIKMVILDKNWMYSYLVLEFESTGPIGNKSSKDRLILENRNKKWGGLFYTKRWITSS